MCQIVQGRSKSVSPFSSLLFFLELCYNKWNCLVTLNYTSGGDVTFEEHNTIVTLQLTLA